MKPTAKRIEELDVLRGFAVFGILVANMAQYFLPDLLSDHAVSIVGNERADTGAWMLVHALVDNKFLTLFSLLFGVSFALFIAKFQTGSKGRWHILRRLSALMVFGLLHGVFLYYADILFGYAVAALLLWPMVARHPRKQLIAGVLLLAVVGGPWRYMIAGPEDNAADLPRVIASAKLELSAALQDPAVATDSSQFPTAEISEAWDEIQAYRSGPLMVSVIERLGHFLNILVLLLAYVVWRSLALFLIGAAAYRSGWLTRQTVADWRRLTIWLLPAGIVANLVVTVLLQQDFAAGQRYARALAIADEIAAVVLAFGYASLVFWVVKSDRIRSITLPIGSVGRLALTNYLLQSALMSVVATHYGLALFGQLSRTAMVLIAVLVFSLQVVLSHQWTRRYRYGPLEWLWRCFTYWSVLPNRLRS